MGLVKNKNHFTDFLNKLLNYVERAYIGSLFMKCGIAKTGLKKLKETLKDPDYTNELMQVSMDDSNINWKMSDLLFDD